MKLADQLRLNGFAVVAVTVSEDGENDSTYYPTGATGQ